MVSRGQQIIPPKGSTTLEPGDHVFVVLRPELRRLVESVFSPEPESADVLLALGEFPLRGGTRVADLQEYYGIGLEAPGSMTLAELFRTRLRDERCHPGSRITIGDVELVAHEVTTGGDVEMVGLSLREGMEEGGDAEGVGGERDRAEGGDADDNRAEGGRGEGDRGDDDGAEGDDATGGRSAPPVAAEDA
jgi:cell volume regulation protein A